MRPGMRYGRARRTQRALARRAQELELDQITTRHWRIGDCSAFTGAGLASGVDWIVQDIASRIFMYD